MYAHYFTSTKAGQKVHTVIIGASMQPIGTTYVVGDKKAAKALAKQHNAKPWNF